MTVPTNPKIYHIVHMDKLPSIVSEGMLLSDAQMVSRKETGTTVGMKKIKERRLNELRLKSYPDLFVGQCVPFYFCPRSVMLFILHKRNDPELSYNGGQEPIIHLEADLHTTVKWAEENNRRWAFTLTNAGSRYFEDKNDLKNLTDIDWESVQKTSWSSCKEEKQAEFLIENSFPWHLVECIGTFSNFYAQQANAAIAQSNHRPRIKTMQQWYY